MLLEIGANSFTSIIYSSSFIYSNPVTTQLHLSLSDPAALSSFSSSTEDTSDIPGVNDASPLTINITTVPTYYSSSATDTAGTLPGYTDPSTALQVSSTYTTGTKTHRALKSTGSYNFQDQVAFLQTAIDPITTSC